MHMLPKRCLLAAGLIVALCVAMPVLARVLKDHYPGRAMTGRDCPAGVVVDGFSRDYYASGELMEEIEYVNSAPVVQRRYDPAGTLREVRDYREGRVRCYDEDGRCVGEHPLPDSNLPARQ